MKRWALTLKLIVALYLWCSVPVFATTYSYGAIPPYYALGFYFVLCLVLYSEPQLRSVGVISFFIGVVVLFSHLVGRLHSFPDSSMLFIILAVLFLFIGYLVMGKGITGENDDETKSPLLSNVNFLAALSLLSGFLCLMMLYFHKPYFSSFFSNILSGIAMLTVITSMLALKEVIDWNLNSEPQKIPFFYVFKRLIFKPIFYGLLFALSIFFILSSENQDIRLYLLIFFVVILIAGIDFYRANNRMMNLPRLPFSDYFMIFFLSTMTGSGILIIGVLSRNHYIFQEVPMDLLFLPSITGFLYFAFILIAGKYRNLGSSSISLCLCFPPVLLIIFSIVGILPINMHLCYNQCQSNLKNIGTAMEMYSDDNYGQYPKRLEQLTPDYIREIPRCAFSLKKNSFASYYYNKVWGFSTGEYLYSKTARGCLYFFYCPGNNHRDWGSGENYPQYNSVTGLNPK